MEFGDSRSGEAVARLHQEELVGILNLIYIIYSYGTNINYFILVISSWRRCGRGVGHDAFLAESPPATVFGISTVG